MDENVNKEGTIYVMKIIKENGLRIGIYSTSKEARERQVSSGIGIQVEIVWRKELSTKTHALAVECLAHLYLAKYEAKRKVGKRTIQIFDCSESIAKAACKKAMKIIDLSGALPNSKCTCK